MGIKVSCCMLAGKPEHQRTDQQKSEPTRKVAEPGLGQFQAQRVQQRERLNLVREVRGK